MDRFVFEKCVCDLQIVRYTEFDHFFSVNVHFTFCVFVHDVGWEVAKFRIRFGIEISNNDYDFSGFECIYMQCIYIYIYICNHENNMPSRLSRQWRYGNSCTWAHDVWLLIAGTNEPKSAQQAKQGA